MLEFLGFQALLRLEVSFGGFVQANQGVAVTMFQRAKKQRWDLRGDLPTLMNIV